MQNQCARGTRTASFTPRVSRVVPQHSYILPPNIRSYTVLQRTAKRVSPECICAVRGGLMHAYALHLSAAVVLTELC